MANNQQKPKGRLRGFSFYIIVVLLLVLGSLFYSNNSRRHEHTYSDLVALIDEGKVEEVNVRGNTVELKLKDKKEVLSQDLSPQWMDSLLSHMEKAAETHDLKYNYTRPTDVSMWVSTIMSLLMFGVMAFFLWLMFSRQAGEGKSTMAFGKSRARKHSSEDNKTTFSDVAGADEEKHELQEVVDFLKEPERYTKLGAKIPRGILLVGPPGTGKTLLARAVAGEAGVPFFSISGSDFVEMFVGVGASRVRDLFEEAKKNSPSIVFIDEIDAVGRRRGAGMGGGHDEREQTLNQLLVEMDGFSPNENVIVMAATNRADILDPALLRPGRFDRRVTVNRPDIRGRAEILSVHARNKPLDSTVNLEEIAKITPGFTGADLANLLNEAALLAARRNAQTIVYSDVSEAVFKVMLGPEKKSKIISDKERYLTAYHEAGHALILRSVSTTDKVERVSIIPAGGAGGYTAHKPHEDSYYETESQLLNEIEVALGGRGAEEIVLGEVSTGASSDLQHCNGIARDMVTVYGMGESLMNLTFGDGSNEVFVGRDFGHVKSYSDAITNQIDLEVKKIIDRAYNRVLEILRDRRQALDAIAGVLMEKEKIDADEFEAIYQANTTAEQRAADPENPSHRDPTITSGNGNVPPAAPELDRSRPAGTSLDAAREAAADVAGADDEDDQV